ncbi:MAG TPA: glycosyltransferase [Blastocatellia bacterium]|jgi:predicted glycosyltransferase|nr:glycosyltransferase [Blastocatellia bacterium]
MQSRSEAGGYSRLSRNAQLAEPAWNVARIPALHGQLQSNHPRPADLSPHKILLYSHDTFGLGNIRRTLLLTEELTRQYPKAAILVVTGSPMIHAFRIPEGVDYIKLPCLDRIEAERYEPRFLSDCAEEMKRTRRAILEKSVLGFAPDLMIVDKRPAGVDGELLETLEALQRRQKKTRLVLGLRDILDEPERTRVSFIRNGSFELIDRFYDEVWVYGSQSIFDTLREYAFPDCVARKTIFCGYLKRPTEATARDGGAPRVLVTTGGGGDGSRMIETYLEGLAVLPRNVAIETTVIFGPQMPEKKRNTLLERFGYMPDVTFLDFEPDLTRRYAEADVVVSMAGYNTVCELLSFARRAILVPRAEPVMEQLIRARLLAGQGLFDLIEPPDLTPENLMGRVLASFKPGPLTATPLDLDGLPRIRERVSALLKGGWK